MGKEVEVINLASKICGVPCLGTNGFRAWSEYGAVPQRLLADMMEQSRSLIDGLFGEST